MIEKKTTFHSEGSTLQASLYYPENASGPTRALVVNSGYQGFNSFYPKMFATRMTERGYTCLGFDYRGMADSEGEKGRVLIDEQVQDIRNAISYLRGEEGVDGVGVIGWGMGAANSVLAGEKDGNVVGVAALNGFYNGHRWFQAIHTYDRYQQILREVAEDRAARVRSGSSRVGETFEHYPLDPATDDYVQKELAPVYGFGHPTQIQFTESILDLDVDAVVGRLAPTPLFIGHGVDNTLHPLAEAEALYAAAGSPAALYRIAGRHNDFMFVDDPTFIALCDELHGFFGAAFERFESPTRVETK